MPDVICRHCAGRYHETTEKFTFDTPTNGSMLRLKAAYKGWDSFPELEGTRGGDLECPQCEGPYLKFGRVRVDGFDDWLPEELREEKPGMVKCPYCTEMFKASGLHFHIKAKHGDIDAK